MPIIQVEHLTKDFGYGRGVFDVTFNVEKGEVYGFLGPNGAGKTTAIRHIMGFSRPQRGCTRVNGLNSWKNYYKIQKNLGYLPGEIALPDSLTGIQFIKMMADLRKMSDMTYTKSLIERFELEPSGGLKRMSLGMKRKLAIVTAFMHDPAVLVLDEPTSGLDPVMQDTFIKFIKSEKERGKTILLSSHIFSEVDATCDKISIIKDGKLVSTFVADDLRHSKTKTFKIEFRSKDEFERFQKNHSKLENVSIPYELASVKEQRNQANIHIDDVNVNEFIELISGYSLKFFSEIKFTLEDYFMSFYDKNRKTKTAMNGGKIANAVN
ncbi:MAG: ABC transporter ATP-binding protein [Nitrososphaerota archaeon]|jgi:ABC-2 type transport system ATP-binding protein|uniref:ABC transporter ATP-binding protein n=1 Tax=Candidatus Bathycorpusculum sp. TaxID=2994959 RepID=UPI00282AC752|nr:ABC transporter ATP-binding protein [Candidatus Termiticorpusculum sp.]MCL2257649.1 ABC transporter ATP-binding protein [Candidatus Termiticorpusculum sp.]MCL2292215.1 ABC transporter ATP-binding protein [Candidatus Termiticorpusculum sp.]MDR0460481.1 ABC transporter ATP-binding protein [Nitrososphaerota archaeon]